MLHVTGFQPNLNLFSPPLYFCDQRKPRIPIRDTVSVPQVRHPVLCAAFLGNFSMERCDASIHESELGHMRQHFDLQA